MIEIKDKSGDALVTIDASLLRGVDLRGVDLRGADLGFADLCNADLRGADLRGADLRGADLRGADLSFANLRGADLRGADLRGTCLDPHAAVPAIDDEAILAAGLEIDGDWVLGYRSTVSQHVGSTTYIVRDEPYVAPWFSIAATECHPGIYLASSEWLQANVYLGPYVRCKCLRSELHRAGDKWRCKRLWIIGGER